MIARLALPLLGACSGVFTAIAITWPFGASLRVYIVVGALCGLAGAASGLFMRIAV